MKGAYPAAPGAQQRLRSLLAGFAEAVFTGVSLPRALTDLVGPVTEVFGAGRTAVWLYERRAREFVRAADSGTHAGRDPNDAAGLNRATLGLRLERTQVLSDAAGRALASPLRGSRRALGTLVMQGGAIDRVPFDQDQYIEAVDGFARQLAAAIENIYLLDEVLRQRRLLEDTFNSLSDLVVVTDDAWRVAQTNHVFAARVGAPAASLLDRPITELIGREMAAWVQSQPPLENGAASGSAQPHRISDERLGGTFNVTVTPLVKHDGTTAGRVVVARDITEQTRLEADQAALRVRLAQTEKLAALGQFVAGIAHEMNNPLQSVLGHLELLLTASAAARPLRKDLRLIYNDGQRAAKIVQNLLAFTGSHRTALRRLQLETVVSRVLSSRRTACRRCRITVIRTRGRDVPSVMGDALLLHQAIVNVVINAEHAVKDLPDGSRQIHVRSELSSSGGAVLTIQDTGKGIAEDVLPQIFNPFFTTREVGEGSGLGLAIAYGVVQDHGGTIGAANAPDGGAIFTIELPAASNDRSRLVKYHRDGRRRVPDDRRRTRVPPR